MSSACSSSLSARCRARPLPIGVQAPLPWTHHAPPPPLACTFFPPFPPPAGNVLAHFVFRLTHPAGQRHHALFPKAPGQIAAGSSARQFEVRGMRGGGGGGLGPSHPTIRSPPGRPLKYRV